MSNHPPGMSPLTFVKLSDTGEASSAPVTPSIGDNEDIWDFKVRLELSGWEIFNSDDMRSPELMVAQMDFKDRIESLYGKTVCTDGVSSTEWFQFESDRDSAVRLDLALNGLKAPECQTVSVAGQNNKDITSEKGSSPFYK